MQFPRTIDEITAEWLTETLRASGAIRDAAVVSFDVANIGDGQGMVGEVLRVSLTYDRKDYGAPRAVIAKSTREGLGTEVRFYREIAPVGNTLAAPKTFFEGYDPDSGDSFILLEDLGHMRAVDQSDDCSFEDASAALRSLALQHGAWWEEKRLLDHAWLWNPDDPLRIQLATERFPAALELCIEKIGEYFPAGFEQMARKYRDAIADAMTMQGGGPHTLIHGDFRLGNMFFDDSVGAASPVVAFDWQNIGRANAANDVGYFIVWSLGTDNRRNIEKQLLTEYHDHLIDLGVKDYSYDEFQRDLRIMALQCLRTTIVAGSMNDRMLATETGRRRIAAMCERNQTLIDWNCEEVIPG